MSVENHLKKLRSILKEYRSVLVAMSGGVDSALLAVVAKETLGEKMLAVTVDTIMFPKNEMDLARRIAREYSLRHIVRPVEILQNPDVAKNDRQRCGYCKHGIMDVLESIAEETGMARIAFGGNVDDLGDDRPGEAAAISRGAVNPLRDAGFTKELIRKAAKKIGLPNWNAPSNACYASRIEYGLKITAKRLRQVAESEAALRELGFSVVRVRHHGNIARVEVPESDFSRAASLAKEIREILSEQGFTWSTLDFRGYHSGSMNLGPTDPTEG